MRPENCDAREILSRRTPIKVAAHLLLGAATFMLLGAASPADTAKRKRATKPLGTPATPIAEPPAEVVIEPTVPAPNGSSPLAELSKSHARLQKLVAKKSPDWSPESEAKNSEIRVLLGQLLDFGELAKRTLPRHWDGLQPDQRNAFVATLRELVERNYLNTMHNAPNYKVTWGKESLQPEDASVTASVETQRKGKPMTLALEYKLLHKARGWLVYDVVTDEQSMLETYRAEFTKIIRKESFEALLDRMKRKLKDATAKGS